MSEKFNTKYSDKPHHLCHITTRACTNSVLMAATKIHFCIRHGDEVGFKQPAKHFSMACHAPNSETYLAEFVYWTLCIMQHTHDIWAAQEAL